MDTRIIEVRKNIAIPLVLTPGTGRYTYTINTVDFIPDEMVVKEIVYSSNKDTEIGVVSLIYTDIVSDVIGSFYIYAGSTPANLIYTIRKPIRGEYSFVMKELGGPMEDARDGQLVIHLEFVKYRTDLPDRKIF